MREVYEGVKMEVICWETDDVIMTSGCSAEGPGDDDF